MKLSLCHVAAIGLATTQLTSDAFLARPDAHFSMARRSQTERSSFVYQHTPSLFIIDRRQYFATPRLNLSNSDDDKEDDDAGKDDKLQEVVPSSSSEWWDQIQKAIPWVFAFVAVWPLLALLRILARDYELDVDTYMTLKDIMDVDPAQQQAEQQILELPPLSPAERLVDVFFGPSSVDRRGF